MPRPRLRPLRAAAALLGAIALATLYHTAPAVAAVPRPDHVVVVIFENHSFSEVLGPASSAPYLRSLAAGGASFSNSHGVIHPSQPNYIALFSGSTQGVTSDACPASANQPFSAFPGDFTRLPTLSFVVPDLCNDMHDCSIATGDSWMRTHLDAYAQWARTHNSLLVVTFDEDDFTASNQIPTLFAGPMVRPGAYSEAVNHYRLLRTLEAMYGLPALGRAASNMPIGDTWR